MRSSWRTTSRPRSRSSRSLAEGIDARQPTCAGAVDAETHGTVGRPRPLRCAPLHNITVPHTGHHSVTPRMVVADPAATVEFLRTVFDATGDPVPDRPAEVQIGDSLIMISAVGEREAFPVFLYVYVDNADM